MQTNKKFKKNTHKVALINNKTQSKKTYAKRQDRQRLV